MIILTIAWRNIWRNALRSSIIMLSVSIGLLAGIFIMGLYKGMIHSRVRTVIDTEVSHIQIHNPEFKKEIDPIFTIDNPSALVNKLIKYKEIETVGTRSITQGMLSTTTGSAGVQINGINPDLENKLTLLSKKIIEGREFNFNKKHELIIGKKLATKLKLKVGKKLVLTFTDTASNMIASAFRISGIYQSDNARLDERNVYILQEELNELLGTKNAAHEIVLRLNSDESTESLKKQIQTAFPNQLVESWRDISPETELMVTTVDLYSYIIIMIILLALAFGIVNTMLMAILERVREIGMMTALGLNKLKMFFLILSETILLTLAGAPLGLLSSWMILNYYNKKGLDWAGEEREVLRSFGFSNIIYPEFPIDKLPTIMTIVIGTAILSCIYPALTALKLEPSEALRK